MSVLGIVAVFWDHAWDIGYHTDGDHPRDGDQLMHGDPSMEIFVNLEYIIHL